MDRERRTRHGRAGLGWAGSCAGEEEHQPHFFLTAGGVSPRSGCLLSLKSGRSHERESTSKRRVHIHSLILVMRVFLDSPPKTFKGLSSLATVPVYPSTHPPFQALFILPIPSFTCMHSSQHSPCFLVLHSTRFPSSKNKHPPIRSMR